MDFRRHQEKYSMRYVNSRGNKIQSELGALIHTSQTELEKAHIHQAKAT